MSGACGNRGFSLVEVLISLALIGVIMAMTVPFAHLQKRLWEQQEERRESARAIAGALAWLTRDLQQAGYHAAGGPIQSIAADSLSYVLSRDEDVPAGFSAGNRRLVTLWRDGSDLKYRIQTPLAPPAAGWSGGSTQVLASGLAGMRCRGLDGAGDETAALPRVALVECSLAGLAGAGERALVRLRCGAREAVP